MHANYQAAFLLDGGWDMRSGFPASHREVVTIAYHKAKKKAHCFD